MGMPLTSSEHGGDEFNYTTLLDFYFQSSSLYAVALLAEPP
jgi:hypothetical protein